MTDDSTLGLMPAPRTMGRAVVDSLQRTSQRVGLGSLASRLAEVRGWLAPDLAALETEIDRLVGAPRGDRAHDAARHLLARPGKRIRPICVLLGARVAGAAVDERVRDLAVACELVHAATLLHDDVIDEGTERRGAPAARTVYGNTASILAGDYLLVAALERVAHSRCPELLDALLHTISEMVAAEALQLERRGQVTSSREDYLRVIAGKTASLFRFALGAVVLRDRGSEAPQLRALHRAGEALGMAFQLVDDVLDLEGDPRRTGKDLFADLLQGKLTWPFILACERDPDLPGLLAELVRRGDLDDVSATTIVTRVQATEAVEDTKDFARTQRRAALRALDELPDTPARRAIVAVVDASVARQG